MSYTPPTLPTENAWTLGVLEEVTVWTSTGVHPQNMVITCLDISPTLKALAASGDTSSGLNATLWVWLIDITTPLSPSVGPLYQFTGTAAPAPTWSNYCPARAEQIVVNASGIFEFNISGNAGPGAAGTTYQISQFTWSGTTLSLAGSQPVPTVLQDAPGLSLFSLSDNLLLCTAQTGAGSATVTSYCLYPISGGVIGAPGPVVSMGAVYNPAVTCQSSLGSNGRTVMFRTGNNYRTFCYDGTLSTVATTTGAGLPPFVFPGGGSSAVSWGINGTADTAYFDIDYNDVSSPAWEWNIHECSLDPSTGALAVTNTYPTDGVPSIIWPLGIVPVTQDVAVPTARSGGFPQSTTVMMYEQPSHTTASVLHALALAVVTAAFSVTSPKYCLYPGAGPNGSIVPSSNLWQWGNLVAFAAYWGTTGSVDLIADAMFIEICALTVNPAAMNPINQTVEFSSALTAIVDMSNTWGLGQVPLNQQNPSRPL